MARLEIPRSSSVYPDDVSPPVSRGTNDETSSRKGRGSPDVSPITDPQSTTADPSPTQGKYNSHIPVSKRPQMFGGPGSLFSRKLRPSAVQSSPRDPTAKGLTRWDDFSGERTAGEKGKPASTSPDAVRRDVELKYGGRRQSLGNSVEISGPNPRVSSKGPWVPVGWKGAGGRHPIVNPMLDKPLPPGKSPTYPAGSHQRAASQDHRADKELPKPGDNHEVTSSSELRPTPNQLLDSGPSQDRNSQSMTEKALPNVVTTRITRQPTPPFESAPFRSAPDTRSPLARNPSNEKGPRHPSSPQTPELTSGGECGDTTEQENISNNGPGLDSQIYNADEQPKSRFSATTCATTVYNSPPTTPDMAHQVSDAPMPSPASSILDRKRPVPPAGVFNSKVSARKPIPSQANSMKNVEPDISRFSKTLPKEPPEEHPISRVETLQAKLDALRRRRGDLQTVIYELTNVVQPSSIAYDIASRQEIKKTVNGFQRELAEVVKEEHETGLKLHRAWKRHDDSTAYEPTHLWVRRVTS